MISFGFAAESCSQPRFHFSSVPGRKFSSRKSAFAASSSSELLSFALAQVQRDRFLVAADHRPPQRRLARFLPPPDPHRIALARRLDLDDLGAEVPEQLAAERTREQSAQFEHPQVGQGAMGEAGLSHALCIQSELPTVN